MALPSFLGHLRKLEAAGLITTKKKGRVRTCALSFEALKPAERWLDEQRALWQGRLDQLDSYVVKLAKEREHGP